MEVKKKGKTTTTTREAEKDSETKMVDESTASRKNVVGTNLVYSSNHIHVHISTVKSRSDCVILR